MIWLEWVASILTVLCVWQYGKCKATGAMTGVFGTLLWIVWGLSLPGAALGLVALNAVLLFVNMKNLAEVAAGKY